MLLIYFWKIGDSGDVPGPNPCKCIVVRYYSALNFGIPLANSPCIKYKPDMHESKENREHASSVKK